MTSLGFNDIRAMLRDDPLKLAERYAPGGRRQGGYYIGDPPWRQTQKRAAFYVILHGANAGNWADEGEGLRGGPLDLIKESGGLTDAQALAEAKAFLGIIEGDPQTQEQIEARRAKAERDAERRAEEDKRDRDKRARQAQAWWLNAQPIAGTPAQAYLEGRGVSLNGLGRWPNALRFAPSFKHYSVDGETGEVFELFAPAMLSACVRQGQHRATHATWLEPAPGGGWRKLTCPKPKKVFGDKKGALIPLWPGLGPRGGKGAALSKCPDGSEIWITEGIEDGLTIAMLRPERRVVAALDLGNMADMVLPKAAARVVFGFDADERSPGKDTRAIKQIQAARLRAIQAHAEQGREVLQAFAPAPHKDFNEALQAGAFATQEAAS